MSPKSWTLWCFVAVLFCIMATQVYSYSVFVDGEERRLSSKKAALYQYIDASDSNFNWVGSASPYYVDQKNQLAVFYVNYTSLRWLTDADTSLSLWHHDVMVVVPFEQPTPGKGGLYISQCSQNDLNCVQNQYSYLAPILKELKVVTLILSQIPNQAMVFNSDPLQKSRREDSLVAYTWRRHIDLNGDRPDWNVYFPMVKASFLATRVLTEWSQMMLGKFGITAPITQFYPFGVSKRAATTWLLTAYMGDRHKDKIFGAAPVNFDTIGDFKETVSSGYQSLGGWTYALKDYADEGIIELLSNKKKLELLTKHIDPLESWYRKGLNRVHKNVITSSQDEFFMLTNDRVYFDKLKNAVRMQLPATDHSLAAGAQLLGLSLAGHVQSLIHDRPIPDITKQKLNWKKGTIEWTLQSQPNLVVVYRAETNSITDIAPVNTKDFRLNILPINGQCQSPATLQGNFCYNPIAFVQIPVVGVPDKKGKKWTYSYKELNVPTDGRYVALYMMAFWNNETAGQQAYTTQTMVLPDTMPFKDCVKKGDCPITLV